MKRAVIAILVVIIIAAVAGGTILWSYLQTPSIEIHDPRFVMTPKAIAVYMMIHNHGFGSDCLVGVDVEAPFKAEAEIHETVVEGGVASMKPVDRICIAGRSEISLEPGGYHIMIMGNLTEDIKELTIVLHFQKSGDIRVRVPTSSQQEKHTH